MPKRLIITVVCFHVSALISLLAGIAIVALSSLYSSYISSVARMINSSSANHFKFIFNGFGPIAGVISFLVIIYVLSVELTVWGLHKRYYWAWIFSIVIAGMNIISGFHNVIGLILGGLALWGLVDPGSVAAFRPTTPTTEN